METSGLIVISVFWFVIFVTHSYLAVKHYKWSKREYRPLEDTFRYGKVTGVSVAGGGHEAIENINKFIDILNNDYKQSNRAQFLGYLAGSVASLIGLSLSISMIFD